MTKQKDVKFHITDDCKLEENLYRCPKCEKQGTKKSVALHYYHNHTAREKFLENHYKLGGMNKGHPAWNKGNPDSNGERWNRGLTIETSDKLKESGQKISGVLKELYANGTLKPTPKCLDYLKSDAHRNKMREITKKRIQLGHGTAKGAWVVDSFGKRCYLGSSYEIKVSEFLNELNVKWTRPPCLSYIDDESRERLYFPDLFLPEFNLYLDPKNSFLLKLHKRKLQMVVEQTGIRLEVITEHDLNIDYIRTLLVPAAGTDPAPLANLASRGL